ncbi:MAG: rod shape-determining protein MreD [Chloroflexi bacterium]|nr:rod shape-determining protein MreD [Chloroflexota bacterium]
MGFFFLAPLLIITVLVQAAVVWSFSPVAVVPDLTMLVVVGWGIMKGLRPALFLAIGGGWLLDSLSSTSFGAATLALIVIAFLSLAGVRRVLTSHILLAMGGALLGTFIYNGFLLLSLRIEGPIDVGLAQVVGVLLFTAIVNTILMPLVYALLLGVDKGIRLLEERTAPAL